MEVLIKEALSGCTKVPSPSLLPFFGILHLCYLEFKIVGKSVSLEGKKGGVYKPEYCFFSIPLKPQVNFFSCVPSCMRHVGFYCLLALCWISGETQEYHLSVYQTCKFILKDEL